MTQRIGFGAGGMSRAQVQAMIDAGSYLTTTAAASTYATAVALAAKADTEMAKLTSVAAWDPWPAPWQRYGDDSGSLAPGQGVVGSGAAVTLKAKHVNTLGYWEGSVLVPNAPAIGRVHAEEKFQIDCDLTFAHQELLGATNYALFFWDGFDQPNLRSLFWGGFHVVMVGSVPGWYVNHTSKKQGSLMSYDGAGTQFLSAKNPSGMTLHLRYQADPILGSRVYAASGAGAYGLIGTGWVRQVFSSAGSTDTINPALARRWCGFVAVTPETVGTPLEATISNLAVSHPTSWS